MARELQPQHTEPHIFFCAPQCIGSLYVLALLQHHKQHAQFSSVPKRLIKDTYHFIHLVAHISTIKPTPPLQPHKQQELFSSLPKRLIDDTHRHFMHLFVYVSTLTPRPPVQPNEQYVQFLPKRSTTVSCIWLLTFFNTHTQALISTPLTRPTAHLRTRRGTQATSGTSLPARMVSQPSKSLTSR